MGTGISCPRCAVATNVSRVSAPNSSAQLELDSCPRCRGMWLDGIEVGQAFAALGTHALRLGDLLAAGAKRGHGIGQCPRCRAETIEFPYFELWLDLCSQCHGLWIDGDEVAAVARTADRDDGLPAPVSPNGYRSQAVSAAKTETVSCARCREVVPLNRTLMTGEGAMCQRCGDDALTPAEEDPEIEELRRSMRLGGSGLAGDVLAIFGGVGKALLFVLGAAGATRCSHCGCSSHSGCGH